MQCVIKNAFIFIMGIGLIAIFLHAIKDASGRTWLDVFLGWLSQFWGNESVGATILVIFMIGVLYFIVQEPKKDAQKA